MGNIGVQEAFQKTSLFDAVFVTVFGSSSGPRRPRGVFWPKMAPKIVPGGVPEASRRPPDRLLTPSLSPFRRNLPPFWPPPGAQDGFLGAILAPFWRPRRPKNGANIDQKSIEILIPFKVAILTDLGRFWEPKWGQVGTQNGSKFDVNIE